MMKQDLVLVVEDDHELRRLICRVLSAEGFKTEGADSGPALDRALQGGRSVSLVVLDLMLPGEDGLSICRRLAAKTNIPILILTAKGDDIDRIVGLELGADDYMGKPFNPRELVARVRAILRRVKDVRSAAANATRFRARDLTIDLGERTVRDGNGEKIPLTSGEFELLACFVKRPRRVLTRDQLLDWTRQRRGTPIDRTIDVQISRLRSKLKDVDGSLIVTVRNEGYQFAQEVESLG
jgi:two-component system, OmpR family, response regulator